MSIKSELKTDKITKCLKSEDNIDGNEKKTNFMGISQTIGIDFSSINVINHLKTILKSSFFY